MTDRNATNAAFAPMGLLLEQYLDGDEEAVLEVHFEDGEVDLLFGSDLFRTHGFVETDEIALAMARGHVLDVGAAAGSHALDLQVRGLNVTAIDKDPRAVATMRERGVKRVFESDVFDFTPGSDKPERFDSIFFLMNGLGISGDLDGLSRLLTHCHHLVQEDGVILADASDLNFSPDPKEALRIQSRKGLGRYAGETVLHMEIATKEGVVVGEPFPWLYVDPDTLSETASACGWHTQVLFNDGEGDALVALHPNV